jgi:hypothetical protein
VDAPVLLNTMDCVLLSPTCTLPKLRLVGLALRVPGAAVPVPDNATTTLEFVASLVTVKVPLVAPADAGAKTTLNVLLVPAAKVSGRVRPFKLKPVPVAEAWVMVIVDPPELVKVSCSVLLEPVCTEPKLRLDGLVPRVPGVAVPVPDSGTLKAEPVASLAMVKVPLAAPADAGAKTTLNVALVPAAIVSGRVRPFKLKPVPVAEAWVMVTVDPPELVNVSCSVLLEPVCTEPKLRLELLGERVPGVTPVPESAMARAPLEASLVMERVPLALPAAAGLKTTLKEAVLPAEMARGRLIPFKLNPDPLRLA